MFATTITFRFHMHVIYYSLYAFTYTPLTFILTREIFVVIQSHADYSLLVNHIGFTSLYKEIVLQKFNWHCFSRISSFLVPCWCTSPTDTCLGFWSYPLKDDVRQNIILNVSQSKKNYEEKNYVSTDMEVFEISLKYAKSLMVL